MIIGFGICSGIRSQYATGLKRRQVSRIGRFGD